MSFFLTWLAFAATQLAATMSPGPAFVVTVRNSVTHGHKAGIYTALGLGLGVATHVGLVLLGLAALMAKSVLLYNFIKYAGAGYLIYLGIKGLRAKKRESLSQTENSTSQAPILSASEALRNGLFTNLLNPHAAVFVTAVFVQFIHPDTPKIMLWLFWFTATVIEAVWFIIVALLLNHSSVKRRFLASAHWIEHICGGLMIALGIKLAVSKL